MKHKLAFSLGIIGTVLVAASSITPGVTLAAEPVKVGVVHSEKFPFAKMMRDAFQMALDAVNQAGGVKGSPLELVWGDDQGDRQIGEKVIRELVDEHRVSMLVGGYSSTNTVYVAGAAEKMDRPFLVCTAADDRITQRGWKNVFRLNPPASGYTKGLEELFLKQLAPRSMAIVYENSPYGTDAALRMMWFCREHDIDIPRIIPYHKERRNPEYYRRILGPLKSESGAPEVIYMVSYLKDALAVVKEIRNLELPSLLCGGAGGFTHPGFIAGLGDSAEHVLTATLWYQGIRFPGTREFYDEYLRRFGTPPDYHAAEAHAALLVAADALNRATALTPAAIRAALAETDLETPFGPVRFAAYDKFGRQNSLPTQVLQIIKGKYECVWPPDLATSEFLPPPGWRGGKSQ